MSPESLFELIQYLSPEEHLTFRNWIRANVRNPDKPPKYVTLYRLLADLQVFDEEKIRKKGFKSSSEFYKRREQLLKSIITCFSQVEFSATTPYSFIITALRFGAWEMAQKYFEQKAKLNLANAEYPELLQLSMLRDEIWEDFRIKLDPNLNLPSSLSIFQTLETQIKCNQLLIEARKAFKMSTQEKIWLANRISEKISSHSFVPLLHSFLHQRLQINFKLLIGKHKEGAKLQVCLTEELIKNPTTCSLPKLIRNVSNAVTSSLILENRSKALFFSFYLAKIDTQNFLQEKLKREFWIKRSIDVGYSFGELSILEHGLSELKTNRNEISNETIAKYLFKGALTYLHLGKTDEGHSIIRNLDNATRSIRQFLPWQIDILNLIFHLEKGNFDIVLDTLVWRKRKFRNHPYLSLILNTIGVLAEVETRIESLEVEEIKREQMTLFCSGNIPKRNQTFDLGLYLSAKQKGKTMQEIYLESKGTKTMSIAL